MAQSGTLCASRRLQAVLASGPFLAALALLLANDLWLKRSHPGLVSGKLSDFSGIAVVGILAAAAFPRWRTGAYLAIVTLFSWWKSPLSEAAIAWVSSISPVRFERVVDFSDLAALLVLPVCGPAADRAIGIAGRWGDVRRALSVPAGAAALVAIMGTSVAMTRQDYSVRPIAAAGHIDHTHVEQLIADVAAANGMKPVEDLSVRDGGSYAGDGLQMTYRFDERGAVLFQVSAHATGFFFATSGDAKANRLRDDLKKALGNEMSGLEFVEPLKATRGGCQVRCPGSFPQ